MNGKRAHGGHRAAQGRRGDGAAGCGGGEPADKGPAPAACSPKVVTIALYGDSTNYGETSDGPGAAPYRVADNPEAVLQSAMDARFGAGAVVVETRAIIGTRLDQILTGAKGMKWGSYGDPWPAGDDADISVENFGINDRLQGRTADQFAADLRTLYALHPVVIETPLPAFGDDGYAQQARDVAAAVGAPLIDVDAFVDGLPEWRPPDGAHPDDAGYVLIERTLVAPALVPLVAPLRCEAVR